MINSILFIDKYATATSSIQLPFIENHTIQFFKNSSSISDIEFINARMVGIVLYESIDLFEIITLYNRSYPLIIATSNQLLFDKINELEYAYTINLQVDEKTIESTMISIINSLSVTEKFI